MMGSYRRFAHAANRLQDVSLLALRLILAYGFFGPATRKLSDVHAIGDWFKSMNYPLPYLNAWMAALTEMSGVILLVLGLATRGISVLLMVVMTVAIATVHWSHGFEASNNGFEIPLYYMLMLLALLSFGAGRLSIDYLLSRKESVRVQAY